MLGRDDLEDQVEASYHSLEAGESKRESVDSKNSVVDIKSQHNAQRSPIDLPDISMHLLIFLDVDSLAAFGFMSKGALSALKKKIKTVSEMKNEDKVTFFHNLRRLSETLSCNEKCEILRTRLATEAKDTPSSKVARYSSRLTTFGGALAYPITKMSYAVSSYIDKSKLADLVRNNFIKKCGDNFFKYTVCNAWVVGPSTDFTCPDKTDETCSVLSDAWKGCQNVANQFCQTCISSCVDISNAVIQRDNDKDDIIKYAAIGFGVMVVGGGMVYWQKDRIKKLFNPVYKNLSQLSTDTQSMARELDFKLDLTIKDVLSFLPDKPRQIEETKEWLHQVLKAPFLLFQKSLVRQRQNPSPEQDVAVTINDEFQNSETGSSGKMNRESKRSC